METAQEYWQFSEKKVIAYLDSSENGLSQEQASDRLKKYGYNELEDRHIRWPILFLRQLRSPLVWILLVASFAAFFLGETVNAVIIWAMILLSTLLGFFNEYRAEKIVADLNKKVALRVFVLRAGSKQEVNVRDIVPGDIVLLSTGSIVPADLRIIEEKSLEIDEAMLTGESMAVRKEIAALKISKPVIQDLKNYAFSGTMVANGYGKGVVIATGGNTEFGKISKNLEKGHPETMFQKGVKRFGNLLIRVTIVLTIFIFLINGLLKHNWLDSLLFALAVAIGLTPELLPAIVSINLSKGAHAMSKKEVIVKRLISIEDIGNMDVLCTDKTGTLTEGNIALVEHYDASKNISKDVLLYSLLCNSVFMGSYASGNPIDIAIAEKAKQNHPEEYKEAKKYEKVFEIPFDYSKQHMAVVVRRNSKDMLIVKGSPESVLKRCSKARVGSKIEHINRHSKKAIKEFEELSREGYRVVAVAYKNIPNREKYFEKDETGLILAGFLTFFDAPKHTAKPALAKLKELNVDLKVLTGDNELVTKKICDELGIDCKKIVIGKELNRLNDEQMKKLVETTSVFARITPEQKLRIVQALRLNGHVVGFMGDGVNDVPAIYEADVGISVDSAVDVAKDAAGIVLLRKSLRTIADGITEGRKIFSNTMKYILMGTSSNFGNMFSVAGASLFLPFLPMLPVQILLTNLIYDVSQMTIPSDNVDENYLKKPRKWDVGFIKKYMLFFGPISSIYDFLTYAVMLFIFHAGASLFQTGWFIESLATEILVVFVIRTNIVPFFKSRPSKLLAFGCLGCVALGVILPFTFIGSLFGFVAPPLLFFGILILMVATYLMLVEYGKQYFFAKHRF
jgi:Mg2+-importing ATPase